MGYTYVDSLLNPEMITGVKIPDIVAFPTGTFQMTADGVLTTLASPGDSVGLQFRPFVGDGATIYPIQTYAQTTAGGLGTSTNVSFPGQAGVRAIYGAFRPVSAMVECEFIGPSSSDGGQMMASLQPSSGQYATPVNWATVTALPNNEIVPVRNGMKILWKPQDNSDFEFYDAKGQIGGTQHYYPYINIAATGLPAAVTYIRYHVVCNFEATALVDATNIVQTSPSPYDPGQLRGAFEWAAQVGNNIFTLYQNTGPYLAAAGGFTSRLAANPGVQQLAGNFARRAMNRYLS
jgi:hypothetical protein